MWGHEHKCLIEPTPVAAVRTVTVFAARTGRPYPRWYVRGYPLAGTGWDAGAENKWVASLFSLAARLPQKQRQQQQQPCDAGISSTPLLPPPPRAPPQADGTCVSQPGSSVQTSLTPDEAEPKRILLLSGARHV